MLNIYEQTIIDSRIESAQNEIRAEHNELESKRILGKKNYFPYCSKKFIEMVNLFRQYKKEAEKT
jgi:hypothetical protein